MAPDVRQALGELLATGEQQPADALAAMVAAGRYHEDVWAGV
jgi:sulfite reductase alpha subunit-like flavoprotein